MGLLFYNKQNVLKKVRYIKEFLNQFMITTFCHEKNCTNYCVNYTNPRWRKTVNILQSVYMYVLRLKQGPN